MRIKVVSLVVVSFLLFLGACEITMRVRNALLWQKDGFGWVGEQALLNMRSKNDKLVYEYRPNAQVKLRDEIIRTNSMGYRDHEYAIPKPEGAYRIAVLGDSVAFGFIIPLEETYSKKLEKQLNENGARKYEVINMGVSGYNTSQEVELFAAKGLCYSPDLVILNYTLNDCEFFSDGGLGGYFVKTSTPSRFYGWLKLKWAIARDRYFDYGRRATQKALSRLKDICGERRIPVIILVHPAFSDFGKYDPKYVKEHQFIAKEALKNNFSLIDLLRVFSGFNYKDVSFEYLHPNKLGHTITADVLYKHIKGERYGDKD